MKNQQTRLKERTRFISFKNKTLKFLKEIFLKLKERYKKVTFPLLQSGKLLFSGVFEVVIKSDNFNYKKKLC